MGPRRQPSGSTRQLLLSVQGKRKLAGSGIWDVPDLDDGRGGDYLTDKITDQAIEFIATNNRKPFFLCFSHYAVHTPIQSPANLVKQYEKKRDRQFATANAESHFSP